ncbi:MAG TPA: DUF2203 domain-containing protein [Planctomycetota bacterium]|nr:DUF2203 domain-containing protein [Planctomycetota bacterium]
MSRRSFTPAEANRTLPLVRRIVVDVLARGSEARALADNVEPGEVETAQARLRVLELEIRDLLEELERIGCSYKDWGFETGLVDFPGEIDGRSVLLCWRSDEESVRFYHAPDAGFAGRKPIPRRLLEDDGRETSAPETPRKSGRG